MMSIRMAAGLVVMAALATQGRSVYYDQKSDAEDARELAVMVKGYAEVKKGDADTMKKAAEELGEGDKHLKLTPPR